MSDDAALRITEIARYHGLSERRREQLASLVDSLADDEHAPSAVRDRERAVDVHLADSLAALDLGLFGAGQALLDIGAGAGFPGLPLAVALPECRFTLLESQRRKCEFIARAIAASGLANATVVCARAEQWTAGLAASDVALARALAPQPVVLEYAAPLLRVGGLLVDWRGRRDSEEERVAARAARELGMELQRIERSTPFALAREHHLHLFAKIGATPARFPRRVGTARKRPLG